MAWSLPIWPATPGVHCVAVLGAESTGKTTLLRDLQQRLQARGVIHAVVPETLRSWCQAQQRLPQREEQAELAHQHGQAIVTAAQVLQAQLHAGHAPQDQAILLADTTPLITALYSQYHFADTQGLSAALAFEQGWSSRLLLGLDLPWTPEPGMRDGPQHQAAFDRLLRQSLHQARLAHNVIYGQGHQRSEAAWQALQSNCSSQSPGTTRQKPHPWRTTCACCADPSSEWTLFTQLKVTQQSTSSD